MKIVPARLSHVGPIATNMRQEDRTECHALGRTPKEALRLGLRSGLHVLTAIEDDGTPTAMLGLHINSAVTGHATPWFLGTERVFMHPRELLCIGRRIIAWWQSEFPHLDNIVSKDNERAIRLLKHWGAIVGAEEQVHRGVAFVPFHFPAIQAPADVP